VQRDRVPPRTLAPSLSGVDPDYPSLHRFRHAFAKALSFPLFLTNPVSPRLPERSSYDLPPGLFSSNLRPSWFGSHPAQPMVPFDYRAVSLSLLSLLCIYVFAFPPRYGMSGNPSISCWRFCVFFSLLFLVQNLPPNRPPCWDRLEASYPRLRAFASHSPWSPRRGRFSAFFSFHPWGFLGLSLLFCQNLPSRWLRGSGVLLNGPFFCASV